MRENILHCSYLQDKIKFLTALANQTEQEAEFAQSDKEFECKYINYKDVKSELKYTKAIYKNDCRLYNLFTSKLYRDTD